MSTDDTTSEKRAAEDADLLAVLRRHLVAEGVRCRIFMRVRLTIGTEAIPPQRTCRPPELIVYGPDGKERAKVTVRTRLWGTAFLVSPAGDAPEFQFPMGQVSEILRWLRLLAEDELSIAPPVEGDAETASPASSPTSP
ncbi:hypothetical protein [Sphaerisporangium dianthi]|uniref:Uncharacterized protein n=1 Tax=Sphaerisporangium dianthi TaxID=1436120 RepID=A0ABV9CIV9_9ACTN